MRLGGEAPTVALGTAVAGDAPTLPFPDHTFDRVIAAEVLDVTAGEAVPRGCQLYVMGGGEDAPQALAARELRSGSAIADAVAGGAAVLAVCAGLQVLGHRFAGDDNTTHDGLGLLDCETHRDGGPRRIGEIVVTPDSSLDLPELTGYENHGGVTTLGPDARPLGKVVVGHGNDGGDAGEGIVSGRVIGTYMHGPVLARNPALADRLLTSVLGALDPFEEPEVEALRRERLQAARHPHLPNLNAGWPGLRSGWRRRLVGR